MFSPCLTTAITTAILLFHHTGHANPLPSPEGNTLEDRYVRQYVDCSKEQENKLGRAFADAAVLANHAFDIDTGSKAWSHYFRTDDGKDEDLKNAKSVWSAVASNNDPTNPPYEVSIRCGKDDHPDCKSGKTVAVTDAKPPEGKALREMLICPLFFKEVSKETVHDISSRKFEKPQRGKDNSWCAPGNNFPWYEVAGHTILHEMTHFDVVGKTAGLPEREATDEQGKVFKSHGTFDVSLPGSYPVAARNLAQIWQKGEQGDQTIKPYQNAENLAGAALEWFMMHMCKDAGYPIDEIPL